MYIVPMEMPKNCNKCPFAMCNYNHPLWSDRGYNKRFSNIDGEENKFGTYGYTCNIDFRKNGRYTKVLRASADENIQKPEWCELKEFDKEKERKAFSPAAR